MREKHIFNYQSLQQDDYFKRDNNSLPSMPHGLVLGCPPLRPMRSRTVCFFFCNKPVRGSAIAGQLKVFLEKNPAGYFENASTLRTCKCQGESNMLTSTSHNLQLPQKSCNFSFQERTSCCPCEDLSSRQIDS